MSKRQDEVDEFLDSQSDADPIGNGAEYLAVGFVEISEAACRVGQGQAFGNAKDGLCQSALRWVQCCAEPAARL